MYRIKDIANLTGLKPATIRMWEKRYKLVSPMRTETNIRLYSEKDLLKLLNITLLLQHKFKISKLSVMTDEEISKKINEVSHDNSIPNTVKQLLKSLTTLDEKLFDAEMSKSITAYGLKKVYLEVLMPFFEKIGVMWQAGSISSIQEHFVSNLVRQTIIVEISKLPKPSNERPIDFILFCREGEMHELSLLFYNYCLLKQNYKTLYLGQNVPKNDLIGIANLVLPKQGLVTSIINSSDQDRLENYLVDLYQKTSAKIFIGGQAITNQLLAHSFLKKVEFIL